MTIMAATYQAMALFLCLSSPFISASSGVNVDHTQINNAHTPQNCSNSNNNLVCEIELMNLKVARLELQLELTAQELRMKSLYIEKCEKKIEEMSHTIHYLESVLFNSQVVPFDKEMVNALEEEVQELEAVVRKNDLNLRLLKIQAKDADKRVDFLASQVQMMAKIVPELWFHVQKLEQAVEVIERRTAELRKHIRNQKCYFFKVINNLSGGRYQKLIFAYSSEAFNHLRGSFSAVKKYHHQLQGLVKREMERNEFTALLAAEELIFFLASAVIVFPLMLALIWLSSQWRY